MLLETSRRLASMARVSAINSPTSVFVVCWTFQLAVERRGGPRDCVALVLIGGDLIDKRGTLLQVLTRQWGSR